MSNFCTFIPSSPTLSKYTKFFDPYNLGQQIDEIIAALKSCLLKAPKEQKIGGLCFDEMEIRSGLVFSRRTSKFKFNWFSKILNY
jgi:hypothetical protein